MEALDALVWPVERLGEAIVGLVQLRGWRLRSVKTPVCPAGLEHGSSEALQVWLELEAESIEALALSGGLLACWPGSKWLWPHSSSGPVLGAGSRWGCCLAGLG